MSRGAQIVSASGPVVTPLVVVNPLGFYPFPRYLPWKRVKNVNSPNEGKISALGAHCGRPLRVNSTAARVRAADDGSRRGQVYSYDVIDELDFTANVPVPGNAQNDDFYHLASVVFQKRNVFTRPYVTRCNVRLVFARTSPVTFGGPFGCTNGVQTFSRNRFNISHKRPFVCVVAVGRCETERNSLISPAFPAQHTSA